MGMVGEACLPSNAYYSRTPDYTLYSGVHVCWSEHSDSPFVYGFVSLDYGLGTMTATTYKSAVGRYRYPNGPITARYRFIKNAYCEACICHSASCYCVKGVAKIQVKIPKNATITKHSLPETPKEGEIRIK